MKQDPYASLKIKPFRFFLVGKIFFTMALQIQGIIVGWQIYAITHDTFALGLIGLSEAIPAIMVSLLAGHVADTVNRRKIILISLTVLLVCSFFLFSFTTFWSFMLISKSIWPIYMVIFVSGLARGFLGPAQFAFMPQLIANKELYSNAVSWNSTLWHASSVVGPALGGLLYGFYGITFTYFIDLVLMTGSVLLIFQIKNISLPISTTPKLSISKSLAAGLVFVFSNSAILAAISLDLFAVLFGGAIALLPAFASDILHVGPEGLGLLRAAPAIGSVLMTFVLIYFPIKNQAGKKMLISVALFGLSMILFGLSTSFYLSFLLLILSGVFDAVSVVIRQTLIQTSTPEEMKGRVSAVNSIFIGSSNEIGAFESGLMARLFGTVPSVVIGGTLTLVVVMVTGLVSKKIRTLHLR